MGWASGTTIYSEIIAAVKANVENFDKRVAIHDSLISTFEAEDAELMECIGEDDAFDAAYKKDHPEWFDGDSEANEES